MKTFVRRSLPHHITDKKTNFFEWRCAERSERDSHLHQRAFNVNGCNYMFDSIRYVSEKAFRCILTGVFIYNIKKERKRRDIYLKSGQEWQRKKWFTIRRCVPIDFPGALHLHMICIRRDKNACKNPRK